MAEEESNYCAECKRMIGVGCTCGMSFKDKVKTQSMVLPPGFKAAKSR